MDFHINILLSNINKELIFGIMRDYRIGGLNPDNYDEFMRFVNKVPNIVDSYLPRSKDIDDYMAIVEPSFLIRTRLFLIQHNLKRFNLKPVTKAEAGRIWRRITQIVKAKTKFCWHPCASNNLCTKDKRGNTKISGAHSLQRSKILRHISEDNKVKQFNLNNFEKNFVLPIKTASTFYGFCDMHDKVFDPIERFDYTMTSKQNFLFAYRAFVHSSHIKLMFYEYYDFGIQAKNDIVKNKEIFDTSLMNSNYSRIKTDLITLDYEYPLSVAFSSDLEFDYLGNKISHSEDRMEKFFMTIFPQLGKTFVLFSYFEEDSLLYSNIFNQIKDRKQIEDDLSVLVAGHCENSFFKPSYFEKYIAPQEKVINKLIMQTQFDYVLHDGYGQKMTPITMTPNNYLNNEFNIQLFFK